MEGACPAYGPDDPLVRTLLGVVDCNVQELIASGYGALFGPGGVFAAVLTVMLTMYVAFIGYRLMLGRTPLSVGDLTVTAVKVGIVLALASQWGVYQQTVYHLLFHGPQQLADLILRDFRSRGSAYDGDVFDGLQRAFVDLTSFSPATPPGAVVAGPIGGAAANGPGAAGGGALSTLLSRAGFDALLLLLSAVVLLVSSLGVLLAAKVVLGILLATGPVFIALLLFDSTRGIFEGWLRASLAFAFAPLAVILTLGVALTMLEPSLQQVETMRASNTYLPGVAFAVMVLVIVFAGVAIGAAIAAGLLAAGFRLPVARGTERLAPGATPPTVVVSGDRALPPRAARIASALAAQRRRDARLPAPSAEAIQSAGPERRITSSTVVERGQRDVAVPARLGQAVRRTARPRAARRGIRSEQ